MEPQNHKALVLAYFISKFNNSAYEALGFQNKSLAHNELSERLGVKSATLKNMRDQFDPLHGHREGWHQRELSISRKNVVEKYSKYSFEKLFGVVDALLDQFVWDAAKLERNPEKDLVLQSQDISSFLVRFFKFNLHESALTVERLLPYEMCSALHAKPFLLFTGLSGSGKTQLAQAFSKWICADKSQIELIAIGADWTSNENLLGYPDALQERSYRKPDNGALDLILRAKENPTLPYFLILDEMNLSHVERYFADFLSAMESGEAISLHDDTGEDWNGVPAKLTIPKNLFVIGTVNVDETTYMFSPKVLDRANVIEFRVSKEEMGSFLANPVKPDLDAIAGQGAQYAKAFVAAAQQRDIALDDDTRQKVSEVLMQFFPELKAAGAEFGYRTAHEICRFVYFYKQLTKPEAPIPASGELGLELDEGGFRFEAAMDAAIMQKLLPKLHGSKKKLGPILAALINLCLKAEYRTDDKKTLIKDELLVPQNALYPSALEKLARMRKRLNEHGFTSFAEA